ncbi:MULTISPECIES: CynX/NimT family MFS transporter [unclassified Colwellia]|jgi:CP family cyanate transporter-like MFS transporter|uniref:MFS transporter n=1 Tax=unclassified Colwellia TaxID=196834 RepID=UPI0015F5B131|nr:MULTISPECIES: MFS transporter [unclassified Colwellia]MBA6339119.1 MFS transporter [Colwellia sp. BRX8-7]MBA6350340.1 MFS transporter [Colwellia sp. BRX8-9]MBA6357525.1 MFS transporter [Colwellia sp. BRX8-3]MBA6361282.1 MFS transporter [Colwellia sp. BRX8-6]MBA6368861.1 MFS transporter [Colwellia sp. BRX8-5]
MRTLKISNKYLVEAIVFISYTLFAMAWVGGTASMNQIMAAMNINSLASASFISGAVTLAKIVGTFAAAWLALKLGGKYAFFASGILISVGLLTPFAPNYELLLVSRFLMGLGGAFMIVYFNPIVMSWFPPEERATINGINAVAFNLGTGIILWQMSNFNSLTGSWQNTLIIFSLASLALSIAWLFVDEAKPHSKAKDTSEINTHYSYTDGLKDKFSWVYALTYSGILAFYLCLFTFYPKAGISQSALLIGFGIIGTLAGIIYSKKFPLRVPVIRWSGLLIVITVFTLSFSPSEVVQTLSAMVLGFSIFFPITALVAIPHELSKMTSQKITVVFSLFYSISYMVGTLVLWLFGKLVDIHQGDYTWAFALTTLVSGTFFIGSFFLTETGQQKNKEDELCEV